MAINLLHIPFVQHHIFSAWCWPPWLQSVRLEQDDLWEQEVTLNLSALWLYDLEDNGAPSWKHLLAIVFGLAKDKQILVILHSWNIQNADHQLLDQGE